MQRRDLPDDIVEPAHPVAVEDEGGVVQAQLPAVRPPLWEQLRLLLLLQRVYEQSIFWRRNPTKTLGFLLPWISPWFSVGFSAFSPTLCTVVSKKTKLSCFGGFFSLVF